jgi:hypothetical protein
VRSAARVRLVERQPAYRCRHGYTSATRQDPARPDNTYICEDRILPHLAALAILAGDSQVKNSSTAFYADFLGLEKAFDLGWIAGFRSPANQAAQVSQVSGDGYG